MSTAQLQDLEARFKQLSPEEQRCLRERLTSGARQESAQDFEQQLAAMACDPEVQRELREIAEEFAESEEDGLENL